MGFCTTILRLSHPSYANHAAVEREIDRLAKSVTALDFVGTTRMASGAKSSFDDDMEEYVYASLHCTNSWWGIARWIAKRQLDNSIGNGTRHSDSTPLLP